MSAEIHLSIHNILAIASSILTLGLALFSYLHGRRKLANILVTCQFLSIAVFLVSHVVGVNIRNPELSKIVFMFNLANFFIAAFNLHVVFVLIGKEREKKFIVNFVYIAAIVLSVLFLIFPELFLLPSVPKMYFPNYYEPGILNWTRVVFVFFLIIPYAIYELYKGYKSAISDLEKMRLKFFILTMVFGYTVGILPNFLVYDFPVDPLWGMPVAFFFTIPFIYGAVQYELLNVKVIAKQAFWYSLAVFAVGGFITLFNLVTDQIKNLYSGFPTWTISLVSSIVAVAIAVLVWRKLKEGDLLKYEFITIVTHKFRTPITVIKWSADVLAKEEDEDKRLDAVKKIKDSNAKLLGLTDLLVETVKTQSSDYLYDIKDASIVSVVKEGVASSESSVKDKNLKIDFEFPSEIKEIKIDAKKIASVFQVLLENAINYSPVGGVVSIKITEDDKYQTLSVRDEGIGMKKEDAELLFKESFFRSQGAKLADPEGMGMGLFISKHIVEQHGGKMWAESPGEGKGTTFFVRLKV